MRTQLASIASAVLIAPSAVALITSPAHALARTCHGQAVTIVGTPGNDNLQGTPGDDVIAGLAGGDVIDGGGGHDVICGNRGNDVIDGEGGSDLAFGQRGNDRLHGGTGDDQLDGGLGRWSGFYGDDGDDGWLSATSQDRLFFASAPAGVRVDLQAGTATGWGTDTFEVGDGTFVLHGSVHDDTLLGTDRADTIFGGLGDDHIQGLGGNDELSVDGTGVVHGGSGNDVLETFASGAVTLDGGDGNDIFESWEGATVVGGAGDDHVDMFLDASSKLSPAGSVDGGTGTDGLSLVDRGTGTDHQVYAHVVYDMAGGTMDGDGTVEDVSGFENFAVENIDVDADTSYDVTGTDGPNDISVNRTTGVVTIDGGGGDDVMDGSLADDTLVGGPGQDAADGEDGTDTCTSVEAPSRCEVVNP